MAVCKECLLESGKKIDSRGLCWDCANKEDDPEGYAKFQWDVLKSLRPTKTHPIIHRDNDSKNATVKLFKSVTFPINPLFKPMRRLETDRFSKNLTVGEAKEYLRKLSKGNSTTSEDDEKMQRILRAFGATNAVVTMGIVYMNGSGRPISIQQAAKEIMAVADKK